MSVKTHVINFEHAVPCIANSSIPYPAFILRFLFDVEPKPFARRIYTLNRNAQLTRFLFY